jgi:hypothetical protein
LWRFNDVTGTLCDIKNENEAAVHRTQSAHGKR